MYFCDFCSGNLKMFLRNFAGCLPSQILEFQIFKIFIYSATLKHSLNSKTSFELCYELLIHSTLVGLNMLDKNSNGI